MTTMQELGRRGAAAAARNNRLRRAEQAEQAAAVRELVDWFEREEIGPALVNMAMRVALAAVQGPIPIPETPLERLRLAETARVLHGMGRLEMGESTSNTATLHVDADALAARLASLTAAQADTPPTIDVPSSDTPPPPT